MKKPYKFLMLLLILTLFGCGKTQMDSSAVINAAYSNSLATNYFKTSQKVIVEVYYETGAEPFAGNTVNGMPYWKILEDNLNAIFQYRSTKPIVVVPKDIASMTSIPAQNKTQWTPDDLVDLNLKYRQAAPTGTEARFYVYFLKGNSSTSNHVIAESVNGTPVIGVYKSVITASGGYVVQRYVEQSTIVHEMGHALGFVNNGVPMKTPHQDSAHGAHSTNSNCVMYYLNEGSADMMAFVSKFISTGTTVMWGPEVLADAQAFSN